MRTSSDREDWIPALPAHGWSALFARGPRPVRMRVVCWADDGRALVVDPKAGALIVAADQQDFMRLESDAQNEQRIRERKRREATEAESTSVEEQED